MINLKLKVFTIIILIAFFSPFFLQSQSLNEYEGYYLYLNTYPDGPVSWGEDQLEVQGITHDELNWYITATDRVSAISQDIDNCFIWKIPVNVDLNTDVFSNPNVTYKSLYNLPEIWNGNDPLTGYVHWGDLDHYNYDDGTISKNYLIIPVTSPGGMPSPAIIVLRASNLTVAGYGKLPGQPGNVQTDVGWCAVDPNSGLLYSSKDLATVFFQYEIPWDTLPSSGCLENFTILWQHTLVLIDENANALTLHNMQGGEFSPSGEMLYISNGRGNCHGIGAPDPGDPNDGINVFKFVGANLHRIKHSINRCYEAPGVSDCGHPWTDSFDFTYDFGCGAFETHSDQPQGLTIWDLDNVVAQNVMGQLHVLTASIGLAGNMAQLVHYSNQIYVDQVYGFTPAWTIPLTGTKGRPFKTFSNSYNWYPAWDGAEIILKAGTYPETGTFSKRIKINSQGGTATIGGSK